MELRKDADLRLLYRRNQVATAIRREVQLGLRGKPYYRRFTLGLSCPEWDPVIVGLSNKKLICSYRLKTINVMDCLLGDKWDICVTDKTCRFVTQLALWETKDGYLSGSIRLAVFREDLDVDYRKQLLHHMMEIPQEETPQEEILDEDELESAMELEV